LSGSLDPSDAHLLFGERGNPVVAPHHPLDLDDGEDLERGEEEEGTDKLRDGEESNSEVGSFFLLASTPVVAPSLSKGGAVVWDDEEEELGKKSDQSTSSSWLGMFK
jgi:hypothetical protein